MSEVVVRGVCLIKLFWMMAANRSKELRVVGHGNFGCRLSTATGLNAAPATATHLTHVHNVNDLFEANTRTTTRK